MRITDGLWRSLAGNDSEMRMTPAVMSGVAEVPALLRRHRSMVALFFVSEAASQLLNAISGLLIVRSLTKADLALFTIVFAFQTTVAVLADTGVSTAITAMGGQRWSDLPALRSLVTTALRFRRVLAAVVGSVALVVFIPTVMRYGAGPIATASLSLWLIAAVGFQIENGVRGSVPRLLGRISKYQMRGLASAAMRLFLIAALAYTHSLNVGSALVANLLASGFHTLLLRQLSSALIGAGGAFSNSAYRAMKSYAMTQAPNVVFYCIEGQLIVWLMAAFGNTMRVADVGALSRVAVIFSLLTAFAQTVLVPSVARISSVGLLRRRFVLLTMGCAFASLAVVAAGVAFSKQVLWLLGPSYAQLTTELALILACGGLQFVDAALHGFNLARGWVRWYWVNIPALVLLQVALLMNLDFSTVANAILVRAAGVVPGILLSAVIAIVHLVGNPVSDHGALLESTETPASVHPMGADA